MAPLPLRTLALLDPAYPSRLRHSPYAPPSLATRGGSLEADLVVAVVGSRRAHLGSIAFARKLSRKLAGAGAVVASGGARGVDGAAHQGALDVGGRTWVVAATGPSRCFPSEHKDLFDRVAEGPGAMLWPLGVGHPRRPSFPARNRILISIADVVVVVQAGPASGALNAAFWAQQMERPLWVVRVAPWSKGFEGSRLLLRQGARPLDSTGKLLRALHLTEPLLTIPLLPQGISPSESKVFESLSTAPLHLDTIAGKAHLPAQATSAALLTLALENVVVEGPPGFFRRRRNL